MDNFLDTQPFFLIKVEASLRSAKISPKQDINEYKRNKKKKNHGDILAKLNQTHLIFRIEKSSSSSEEFSKNFDLRKVKSNKSYFPGEAKSKSYYTDTFANFNRENL